ncbi:MAG: DNA-processing protein DprA [Gammaproteobacteria bacterium]
MTEIENWLKLWHISGIGPKTFHYLLTRFPNVTGLFNTNHTTLIEKGIPKKVATAIINDQSDSYLNDIQWLKSHSNNHIVLISQANYPDILKEIYLPPPILYARGNLDLLNNKACLGIVGGRKASSFGQSIASKFSSQLAELGISIVSGLARGIDKQAHMGALRPDHGSTIAILAHGIDSIYPAEHTPLANEIACKGLLLSEFPPGVKPLPRHFPRRNRIISGLSLGTIVIEAAKKSGSLITARYALEQGREVFAVPGPINNPLNRGCHELIKQGAKLTTSIEDVLEELNLETSTCTHRPICTQSHQLLSGESRNLLAHVEYTPLPIEIIIEKSGLTPEQVCSMLMELENGGQVTSDAFGHYSRA